jgi:hypothetical protein
MRRDAEIYLLFFCVLFVVYLSWGHFLPSYLNSFCWNAPDIRVNCCRRGSSLDVVCRLWTEGSEKSGAIPGRCKKFFSFPHRRTDTDWHHASYSVGIGCSFPGQSDEGMKLTTVHPVQRLRMSGAVTPLPQSFFMA